MIVDTNGPPPDALGIESTRDRYAGCKEFHRLGDLYKEAVEQFLLSRERVFKQRPSDEKPPTRTATG